MDETTKDLESLASKSWRTKLASNGLLGRNFMSKRVRPLAKVGLSVSFKEVLRKLANSKKDLTEVKVGDCRGIGCDVVCYCWIDWTLGVGRCGFANEPGGP